MFNSSPLVTFKKSIVNTFEVQDKVSLEKSRSNVQTDCLEILSARQGEVGQRNVRKGGSAR